MCYLYSNNGDGTEENGGRFQRTHRLGGHRNDNACTSQGFQSFSNLLYLPFQSIYLCATVYKYIYYIYGFILCQIWLCIFFSALCVLLLHWMSYRNDEKVGSQLNLSRWFLYVVASLSIGERSINYLTLIN